MISSCILFAACAINICLTEEEKNMHHLLENADVYVRSWQILYLVFYFQPLFHMCDKGI